MNSLHERFSQAFPSLPTDLADAPASSDTLPTTGAADNHEEAFAELVRQQGGRLLAVARRLLRSEEDSADAVQDALLSAFRSLGAFTGRATLSTWLHSIVVNACLMKLRRRERQRGFPINDLLDTGQPVQSYSEQPYAILARAEIRAHVRACIDRLPEDYRTVLLLRDIKECDTDQTARQLGISPSAVKTRLHRARLALRTLIQPQFAEEERFTQLAT